MAARKSRFDDYMVDAVQGAEELYLDAGKSLAEAKALAANGALLPHLAQLKALAQDMAGLEQQYLAAGDGQSAENLAQYGLQLSRQLSSGEGSRVLIDQLVGCAAERIILSPLERDRNYDFVAGTVSDRLAQLDAFKSGAKQDAQFIEQWLNSADEAGVVNYFERLKLYGERGAIRWLRER